ncbi:formyl transferase [Streptomyces gobiensis]|uniref:formyl transferase n=1 Tax=Streptomyces gobiensis TaxID=2875706 RepID=UPI001E471FCE|nr:formyl transferase [Streptomyces gobiensis]UGY94410.1 formyl transferase [Streptomyces gobiensis]
MRILVCSQDDVTSCVALNRLLPGLTGNAVAVALVPVEPGRRSTGDPGAWLRWFGNLFNERVRPELDRRTVPPGELLTYSHLARQHGTPIRTIREINRGDGYAFIKEFAPDVILSVRFGLIFKPPTIALARLGVLNIHPGALPRYAGLFSPMYAMLAGESSLGSTLHVIDAGIDTGPIIGIRRLPVDPERSMFWHGLQLYPLGIDLFLRILPDLESGRWPTTRPQDRRQRQYRSWPSAADFAAFRSKGLRLADSRDYLEIIRRFRTREPSLAGPDRFCSRTRC